MTFHIKVKKMNKSKLPAIFHSKNAVRNIEILKGCCYLLNEQNYEKNLVFNNLFHCFSYRMQNITLGISYYYMQ